MPQRTDHRLTIRFTREEFAEISAKAGNTPLAAFVRERVLEKVSDRRRSPGHAPVKDHVALAQVLALLGPSPLVGSFREAARGIENGSIAASDDLDAVLRAAATDLSEIKTLLMTALGVAER